MKAIIIFKRKMKYVGNYKGTLFVRARANGGVSIMMT